jgi:hypothetical protein
MSDPIFGIGIRQIDNEPRPAIVSDMSIVGICGPAIGADPSVFPLNTPKELYSDDLVALAKLGTGALADAVSGINDQLGEFEVAARIVIVRVALGLTDDETIANITGSSLDGSGIWAFLKSGPDLGIIPRIILTPGYTAQFTPGSNETLVTKSIKDGGNLGNGTLTLGTPKFLTGVQSGSYSVRCIGGARSTSVTAKVGIHGNGLLGSLSADTNATTGTWRVVCVDAEIDTGSFSVLKPGGELDGIATVGHAYNGGINFTLTDGSADFELTDEFNVYVAATVPPGGGLFSVVDPTGNSLANATEGVAYTTQISFTIDAGGTDYEIGDGFDVAVVIQGTALANSIIASMPSVLDRLLGVAIVTGPTDNDATWTNWRETIQSQRIIPLASSVFVGNPAVAKDAAPRIAGIFVRRDHEKAGLPFWSSANQPVAGVVGPTRNINFSLTDGSCEGQQILSQNGGIIARGQMGVEQAIASGGFVYIGTDTCSEDTLWQFYNVVRGRDFIHLMFLRTLRFYLGRFNISAHTITAILNTMKIALRDLQAQEAILGFDVGFSRDLNSPENIRLGKFRVSFQAEESPVLRYLGIDSARYRPAIDALLNDLIISLASVA